MPRDWELVFTTWSQGPSATEQQKSENAENQVRRAISASEKLRDRNIKVITQGSYRNRVNVRKDSDVDIGVICYDNFFPEFPDDNIRESLSKSFSDSTYTYLTFKDEIEEALVYWFGRDGVSRGKKAFDIKENTYRVAADVVAFFEHRRYQHNYQYLSGVEMIPDDYSPPRIRNWPEQHYANGVKKNNATNRRFKRLVRILKTLSNEMAAAGVQSAEKAPSFLIESMVWNVPDYQFNSLSYFDAVRNLLAYLFNNTIYDVECEEWSEVSDLKYLFRASQPWTREGAHAFISDAWNYIGYK